MSCFVVAVAQKSLALTVATKFIVPPKLLHNTVMEAWTECDVVGVAELQRLICSCNESDRSQLQRLMVGWWYVVCGSG